MEFVKFVLLYVFSFAAGALAMWIIVDYLYLKRFKELDNIMADNIDLHGKEMALNSSTLEMLSALIDSTMTNQKRLEEIMLMQKQCDNSPSQVEDKNIWVPTEGDFDLLEEEEIII